MQLRWTGSWKVGVNVCEMINGDQAVRRCWRGRHTLYCIITWHTLTCHKHQFSKIRNQKCYINKCHAIYVCVQEPTGSLTEEVSNMHVLSMLYDPKTQRPVGAWKTFSLHNLVVITITMTTNVPSPQQGHNFDPNHLCYPNQGVFGPKLNQTWTVDEIIYFYFWNGVDGGGRSENAYMCSSGGNNIFCCLISMICYFHH